MPQQQEWVWPCRPGSPFPSFPAGGPSRRRARVVGRSVVSVLLGLLVFLAPALTPVGSTSRAAIRPPGAAAAAVTVARDSGTALTGFMIQSTALVKDPAAEVSSPGYTTQGWYRAGPRSTVLGALLAAGTHPDPFHSTNQKLIPAADFAVPWWYRSDFSVDGRGTRTYLDFSGVTSAADVFVNGRQVSTASTVAGTYTRHELDITALIRPGTNTVAFRVQPNDPRKHLTMGWLDWLQPPPDQNMGIVRDVVVRRSGPVVLRDAHVVTDLAVPSLASADLTVKAQLRNDSADTVTALLSGTAGPAALSRQVTLKPGESRTVVYSPADHPGLHVASPRVWWPAGMGEQPLYDLDLAVTVDGVTSDTAHTAFGIRDVEAPINADDARQYRINGRPLLIKGAGWSPDEFMRWDPAYVEHRLQYVRDLGLNTLRLEGHLEPDEFFDLADRYGILTLPGWECCDKWEGEVNRAESGEKWDSADHAVAQASMAAEAARLRHHPSVISFLIGSDAAPNAEIESEYLQALRAADWDVPVIPSASGKSTPVTGRSGMRMTGPYDWVPPGYWYDKREGGATGFNSETSAGPSIPTLDTLRRMLTPAELETLWKQPSAPQYHRSPSSTFSTLKLYNAALAGRYGPPTDLGDYVRKAQLAQYENVRAQFEAYSRNAKDTAAPATGVIYWMLNSGWTSLHWQLIDRYLDQNGAYFGAKKANEPLHIQYGYDNRAVSVVNDRATAVSGLNARVTLFNPDGTEKYDRTVTGVEVGARGVTTTSPALPATVPGLARTYLARLLLTDATGRELSRNVYWLSTRNDVLDHAETDWYHTPTTSYADLSGLSSMPQVSLEVKATTTATRAGTSTTSVTLRHPGTTNTPALLTDVDLVSADGTPLLPVRWSDNQITLWPGESVTVKATHGTDPGRAPRVRVSGWNARAVTVPLVVRAAETSR
ncbi:exo-beta-D-glucosaminidase [Streptomyces sp. NPDC006326]|uniref:glycoside hydrolase family 2 protein n=1 Tax=Streptomyces sp. NPDC006326 TaxID=3156752 RepID=UPI0033B4FE9F